MCIEVIMCYISVVFFDTQCIYVIGITNVSKQQK